MSWNFDISSAPRGRHETRVRTIKAEKQEYDVFIPERVLIAHPRDGLVYASYWIEPNKFCTKGRWAGWREGDEPLAWQPYPVHPSQESDCDAFAAVKGKARLADHTKVEPSLSDRQYLEKIADQVIARNSPETVIEQPKTHGSSPCIWPREGHRPATYGQLVTGGESAASQSRAKASGEQTEGTTGLQAAGPRREMRVGEAPALVSATSDDGRDSVERHAHDSKTDAAISRPGKPRPEIENRSDEEPCQARGSGEMQDEDAIHLPPFSKAETSREASPAAGTESAQSGAGVVSVCPALIDDVGGF